MTKDIIDLTKLIENKTSKQALGEVVSLCKFRENKHYLEKRAKKIKDLEEIRKELETAEFILFNFITLMDEEQQSKGDYLAIEQVRFTYEHWYLVRDIVDRRLRKIKHEQEE